MVLAEYTFIINVASKELDAAFDIRPKASITVERVPAFKEEGMAQGSYNGPAMDGSKGGVFLPMSERFLNTRNMA